MIIKMLSNKNKLLMFFVFILVVLFVSFMVGGRDYSIGTDTYNYDSIFVMASYSHIDLKHEIGFVLFVKLVHFLGLDVKFFFASVAFFVTFFMYLSFLKLSNIKSDKYLFIGSCCFFAFLFFSNWHFTGIVNGLRHAMALSLFYYSLFFLKERRFLLFFLIFFISVFFHKTNIILLPFVLISLISSYSLRVNTLVFLFFAAGYAVGANEYLVMFFSKATGMNLYGMILEYGLDDWGQAQWQGFDIRFFVYNLFWFLLPYMLKYFDLIEIDAGLEFLIKIYSLLCIFYFVFGFGAFSNRWAYPSWLILPIFQACILLKIKMNYKYLYLSFFFYVFSVFYILSRVSSFELF